MNQIILEAKNISKSFGKTQALKNVDFYLNKAQIHGLLGENGAGKSSLMNILSGIYQPETGSIYIEGKKIKKLNPKIQLGFNRRYDPGHSSLKKELQKGKIGRLEKIIITSRDPAPPPLSYLKVSGGIFKDMMIHDFDLARFYLEKDEVSSIFSTGSNISDKKFDKIKDYELASCILRSKKGVQCIIANSRHCSFGYDQRVELFGSKGMLISGNKKENETEIFTKNNTSQKKPLLNFFIDRYVDAYRLQLDELARYTLKKNKPISSFEDGRRALILANAASNSLKQRKQIKIKF